MLNEVILGWSVAFAILELSIFFLFQMLIRPQYFAVALGLWILYSAHRLFVFLAKRPASLSIYRSDKDALDYWLAPLASSLPVLVLFLLVVSQNKLFP